MKEKKIFFLLVQGVPSLLVVRPLKKNMSSLNGLEKLEKYSLEIFFFFPDTAGLMKTVPSVYNEHLLSIPEYSSKHR